MRSTGLCCLTASTGPARLWDWCAAGGGTLGPLSGGGGGGLCSVLPNIFVRDLNCFASLLLLWPVLFVVADLVRLLFLLVSSDSGSSVPVSMLFDSVCEIGVIVNSDFFFAFLMENEEDEELEMDMGVNVVVFVVRDEDTEGPNNFGPTFAFLAPI